MKDKAKVQITKTRVPIYRSSLWIVLSNNIAASIDHVEDLIWAKIEDKPSTVRALAYSYQQDNGSRRFILFLRPSSKPGEIVHEIKHIVNMIFAWHGVKLSVTNDESECYFLERITNTVFSSISRYKKTHLKTRSKQPTEPKMLREVVETK